MPDLKHIIPEGILILSALGILMEGVFRKTGSSASFRRFSHYGIIALFLALVVLVFQHKTGEKWVTFEGQILQDDFIYFAKILILIGSMAVLAISLPSMMKEHIVSFEYSPLILFATIGMLLMVEANDFMTLFVGLEMQGLSLYILAALSRDQITASEAALKYFILGALATCLYLYGSSLIYGFSGTTNFQVISSMIRIESTGGLSIGLFIGLIFIMASLSFKVSAVPFHMWTPDVYQGCPTPITAFIAAAPKVAAMVVFLRIMVSPFLLLYADWQSLIIFISFASMALGAFAALRQTDLKRLLAYSAIGQMGYVLMGLAAANDEGIQAVFVYLTIYLIMIIGTFGCLLCLRGKGFEGVQNIEDLSGISTLHPKMSFTLAVFMFSLAGIPPLAGFFAKLYVFKAAISAGLFGLAIVGVLSSVVAAYYYLKIVKVMYFDDVPSSPAVTYGQVLVLSPEMTVVLNICVVIILLFFIFPNPVLEMAQRAALALPI
ncbi:MAG: NADH-quinone oxidoreductase subunit N [Alphaproteobacteria bacterium 41-28]|nr:MAG: NADH-quinone oxidoreductase subunit N [Alphaproteobacteria bacterium 41-28]